MTSLIYLDNSTTARPSEKAISAMMPYWTTYWGIPTTPHQKGQELYPALADYYKTLYAFIGAKENDQVILTSSGAEAVNHVIFSAYRDVTLPTGKNQFLTSKVDEASAMMAISRLEPFGCVGKMIEVNQQGIVTAAALADCLSPRTALVSLSWANGLTGVIQPIAEIAKLCKQRGIRLHLDATHVLGKLFYELEELSPDYLTFNGDQLHAPKGTGILYVKQGVVCSPFIFGSADQGGMRAGGLNMPGLAGLATAAQEALDSRDLLCTETARLRNQLERGILKGFPRAQVCFQAQERLPHCTTILFPGIANEALLFILNRRGVCASIGGGNFQQLGLMLVAAGIEENLAHSAVSFSLSRYTTEEEIERAIQIIVDSAQMLARLSEHIVSTQGEAVTP
jgi:cysteine desulfurase